VYVYVYVYAYVYVRVHIHIHTHTCASHNKLPVVARRVSSACFDWLFILCLLGVSARTDINNPKEDALQDFIHGSPDDSGSKLRDKEQQRLSSK